jgi:hypothetical protein
MMILIQIIKWFFIIVACVSAVRISTIARSETGESKYFASITDIFDYVEITRRRDGKIGIWFWIFVVSFTFFIALIILPAFG